MSFTSIVKNEVSKLELTKIESIALLSSIIRNSEKTEKTIKITTENSSLARTIFKELKEIYGIFLDGTIDRWNEKLTVSDNLVLPSYIIEISFTANKETIKVNKGNNKVNI